MAFGGFAPLPLRLGGTAEEGLTAAQFLRICADLSAARRTMPFAVLAIDQNTNDPVITAYRGQNGVGSTDMPTIAWDGTRTVITFATSYKDDARRVISTRIRAVKGTLSGSAAGGRVLTDDLTLPNVVKVAPVSFAGAGLSAVKYLVVVR